MCLAATEVKEDRAKVGKLPVFHRLHILRQVFMFCCTSPKNRDEAGF